MSGAHSLISDSIGDGHPRVSWHHLLRRVTNLISSGASLWTVIKDEDRVILGSELAERHFKEHGRPLRIAVDEADWVYNNVTREHVARVRYRVPEYRGIEKNIFYRICNLLSMNVQLFFVFDSPDRPPKRGRRHGVNVNPGDSDDLKEVLRAFRIPFHQAKGEAEAECVRLEKLGVVDAVWSQDSDCLLFGCNFLIHDNRVSKTPNEGTQSKGNTVKDNLTMRVVHGSEIRDKHNLDKDGLLLFTMLCGGDLNPQGVKNCGRVLAARAVRDGVGEGLSLCETQADCLRWSGKLVTWLSRQNINNVDLDLQFPNIKILNLYKRPKLYSDDELMNLACLRRAWDRRLDERELFELTSSFFNIWGKDYLRWIGPILLTRWLVERDISKPHEHAHNIKAVKQRTPKNVKETMQPRPSALKLRFSPFRLTTLSQWELMNSWTKKGSLGFDPNFRVEAQFPAYLVERALPQQSLGQTSPASESRRKRARGADAESSMASAEISRKKQQVATINMKGKPTGADPTVKADVRARLSTSNAKASHSHSSLVAGSAAQDQVCINLLSDSDEIEDDAAASANARNQLSGSSSLRTYSILVSKEKRLERAIALSLQDGKVRGPSQQATSKAKEPDFIDLTL